MLWVLFFSHGRPGRAATCSHKWQLFWDFFDKVFCLLNGTKVSTGCYFFYLGESHLFEGFAKTANATLAKLTNKRRSHNWDNGVTLIDGLNYLENLTLISNCTKGAVDQALTTRYALLVINICATMLIGANSVHTTSSSARTYVVMNCLVRANLEAHATLNALLLVNVCLFVYEANCLFRTNLSTRVRKTTLACVGNAIHVVLAGVTRKLNDVNQRWLVINLRSRGLFQAVRNKLWLINALHRHAHSHANALANNSALQEDALTIRSNITRNNLVRQLFHLVSNFINALICFFIRKR